jgi:hypothetical protein
MKSPKRWGNQKVVDPCSGEIIQAISTLRFINYVLMATHVHLVVETTAHGGDPAQNMKCINLRYAQHYKNQYGIMGTSGRAAIKAS